MFRLFAVGGMGVEDDLCSVEVFSPTSGQWHYLPAQMKEVNGWCSACLGKTKCTMVTWQQVWLHYCLTYLLFLSVFCLPQTRDLPYKYNSHYFPILYNEIFLSLQFSSSFDLIWPFKSFTTIFLNTTLYTLHNVVCNKYNYHITTLTSSVCFISLYR